MLFLKKRKYVVENVEATLVKKKKPKVEILTMIKVIPPTLSLMAVITPILSYN